MVRKDGLKNQVKTGEIEEQRAKQKQGIKYTDSLGEGTGLKDNMSFIVLPKT